MYRRQHASLFRTALNEFRITYKREPGNGANDIWTETN